MKKQTRIKNTPLMKSRFVFYLLKSVLCLYNAIKAARGELRMLINCIDAKHLFNVM